MKQSARRPWLKVMRDVLSGLSGRGDGTARLGAAGAICARWHDYTGNAAATSHEMNATDELVVAQMTLMRTRVAQSN